MSTSSTSAVAIQPPLEKHLIPEQLEMRQIQKQIFWNPLTFTLTTWLYPLMKVGYKKLLVEEDLPLLADKEQSHNLTHWLDKYISQASDPEILAQEEGEMKPKLTLIYAILPYVMPMILIDALCQIVGVATTTLQSLLIQEVLKFVDSTTPRENLFIQNGYGLACVMFGVQLLYTISQAVSRAIGQMLQLRVKTAIVNAVYKKSLTLSSEARRAFPPGKINSLVGSDSQSIMNFIDGMNKIWSMPIQLVLSIYFVSTLLHASTTVAAGVFIGLGALSAFISGPLSKAFKGYAKSLDDRTNVLREFLYGVKVVKYQGLEESMEEKIMKKRKLQEASLMEVCKGFMLFTTIILLQNSLTGPLTFITYGALENDMDPTIVFPALSFLSSLFAISDSLPQIIFSTTNSIVSYKRLSSFLLAKESDPNDKPILKTVSQNDSEPAIHLDTVSFTWERVTDDKTDEKPKKKNGSKSSSEDLLELSESSSESSNNDIFKLEDVSLSIKRGSLVAVVGATGSGKSSLLAGLAGAMRKTGGQAVITGSVAYCAQEPWIISGTIQENITLLDNRLNDLCTNAIEACSLKKDLTSFPAGIGTQIGEKGINLSGGQKARIALARAITKNPDVYILDDPLSALDAHVSKDIFDGTIRGPLMKPKTVIIATHLLHILPSVDQVVVMDGGKIVQNGTFSDLMVNENGKLFEILKDYHLDDETEDDESKSKATKKKATETEENDAEMQEAEDRETGAVSSATYESFARALGYKWVGIMAFCFVFLVGISVVQQLSLSAWTANTWNVKNPTATYLGTYSSVSALLALVDLSVWAMMLFACARASCVFHDKALKGLLRAPMSFYDQQPIGRILNRMGADVRNMDMNTGMVLLSLFDTSYLAIGILVITCVSSPIVIPIVFGLVCCVWFIYAFFKPSYRELRRLTSIMQSPLTAHVSETLTGTPTILAYNAQDVFTAKQFQTLDKSILSTLLFNSTMFWVTTRLNVLSAVITFIVALFGVSGIMPASYVGVALTQITYFAPVINTVLILAAQLEVQFVSAERLNFYAEKLPSEAQRSLPKDGTLNEWPSAGSISIDSLTLAYESRPDHNVINGISLKFNAGEKIGVVGRTGSGKSTLMDAFFRIIEATGGRIEIDGQDIATLGLKKLRSSIQMIPQNPILFDGTVKSNIDATGKYSDKEIWYALECCGMKEYVVGLSAKLDSVITQGGTNLSAGQRQLLCLAKVLLEKSKILIMDEATSSVDAESDLRIQESMKTYFKDATVLSVAHRLNTIAAFDKVLVLENGKVAEFDAPHLLLMKENSIFAEMVNATGVANAAVIRNVAKNYSETNETI
ncbi:Multidrug resistance-associated protein 1 [Physocladia obscura]|uniref:Multidrug resistance-associated protein 1 n=1 Tax=Physocladia obscura TaxID=109957 RepID=A0AAD5T1Q5_9FUNG|nr:Multidrug resistance-associated protein 1 [Physocladia obscura]